MLRAEATDLIDVPEVGSSKTEEGFRALYAMSPYYFVKDRTPYPAALFTAGINDPRLKPWQSAKMTAHLQAATTAANQSCCISIMKQVTWAGRRNNIRNAWPIPGASCSGSSALQNSSPGVEIEKGRLHSCRSVVTLDRKLTEFRKSGQNPQRLKASPVKLPEFRSCLILGM